MAFVTADFAGTRVAAQGEEVALQVPSSVEAPEFVSVGSLFATEDRIARMDRTKGAPSKILNVRRKRSAARRARIVYREQRYATALAIARTARTRSVATTGESARTERSDVTTASVCRRTNSAMQ